MKKIYKALSLTIDISSIKSIENKVIDKESEYFIKINGQEHRVFSLSEHEKYREYLVPSNKGNSLCFQRRKTDAEVELMNLYYNMAWEIKKPISEMVKLEVEKLINYWTLYNNGLD